MKRMALEISASVAMGFTIAIVGIFLIITDAMNHDIANLVRDCAYIALGAANAATALERLLYFKLNAIHKMLGPYEVRKPDRFEILGNVLKSVGMCASIGGTILLLVSSFGHLSIENSDLSIGLLAIGFAFLELGRAHADNRKYDDIAEGINNIYKITNDLSEGLDKISHGIDQIKDRAEARNNENSITNDNEKDTQS